MAERIYSIDPGKHLGWVYAELEGTTASILNLGVVVGYDKGSEFVKNSTADIYVVEDYTIRPNKWGGKNYNHDWSKGETLRQIGQLEIVALMNKADLILQPASIKPVGYGWAGLEYVPGKKGMHLQDAYAHLIYFLVKTRQIPLGELTGKKIHTQETS